MTTNVQPFYPIPFRTLRPAGLIPASSYAEAAEAADALPVDASDARDIGVEVGDFVVVQRPCYADFYGNVEAVDGRGVSVWSRRECRGGWFDADAVSVVVKATAKGW